MTIKRNAWTDLSDESRRKILEHYLQTGDYDALDEYGIRPNAMGSAKRSIRYGAEWVRILRGKDRAETSSPVPLEELAAAIKGKAVPLSVLCRRFDRSDTTIMEAIQILRDEHYNIVMSRGVVALETSGVISPEAPDTIENEGSEFCFGVASDLHAGSIGQQVTALRQFVGQVYAAGVRHIFVPGDVTAGFGVYRGQIMDLYAHGSDAQLRAANATIPSAPGLHWHMIGGNHDYSYVRTVGYNVVEALCESRSDLHYYGFDMADVPVSAGCVLRMWHPSGGVPYALSYRLQKGVEQMAYQELREATDKARVPSLRLLLAGHLHIHLYAGVGSVHGFQSGAFEGQTNYLKRKGLYPSVGGWLVSVSFQKGGAIKDMNLRWLEYPDVESDWMRHEELLHVDEDPMPQNSYLWEA